MAVSTPFARPMYVMLKPAGAACNLACDYCYYLEKGHLHTPGRQERTVMSDRLLEQFTEEYIGSQTSPYVLFTWHGGETLLRPVSFYERAVELQQKYAGGRQIDNCIQTNGTLLNADWCKFFHDHRWLVGLSIDGPERLHDAYRRNRAGMPSFRQVMRGVTLLDRYGVEWNALATVNRLNADFPVEVYRFFQSIDCHYMQFTPVVERLLPAGGATRLASRTAGEEAVLADFSVLPAQWGHFLCALFDEWVKTDVGTRFVQLFDATLALWAGEAPGLCSMAPVCGQAGVMEYNGDVYSCDHFVFPEYKLGNMHTEPLASMMYGERQAAFGAAKSATLPGQCRRCEYLFACNGECPKNRFAKTADGEPGLNYLCEGYRAYFTHVAPYMDFMKNELDHRRPPANVMQFRP